MLLDILCRPKAGEEVKIHSKDIPRKPTRVVMARFSFPGGGRIMDSRTVIHCLLHLALAKIRLEGADTGNEKLFRIAELLHPLPFQLERVAQGVGSYAEILAWVGERAQQQQVARWLDNVIEHQRRWHSNDSRALVHGLLYLAMIEIREAAYKAQNDGAFCLADVFHNAPHQLERVLNEEMSYDEVLQLLRERAEQRDCGAWFSQALEAAIRGDCDANQATDVRHNQLSDSSTRSV